MITSRLRGTFFGCLLVSSAFCGAQVPLDFIVVSESNTAPDGFRLIDPSTGAVTEIFEPSGNFIGSAAAVGIDGSGNGLLTSAGFSFGGPPLVQIPLVGNTYDFSQAMGQGLQLFGQFGRIHADGSNVLFTLRNLSPGLYTMTSITGQPMQLSTLNRAADIAVIAGKAYVNSFEAGQPSTVIEVDLATGTERTLGTAYPTLRSLGNFGGLLLAGRDDGNIDLIDIATGASTGFSTPGLGAVISIAQGGTAAETYFATDANEVYNVNGFASPVYTSPHTITDIDVGRVAQPAQLIYGQGCAGSAGTPAVLHTGGPSLGQPYNMSVTSTQPMANVGCVVGFSRLDVDLGLIGFSGCTLLNTGIATLSTTADATGNASVSVVMPSMPSLAGLRFLGQFFVIDTGSGSAQLASSEGLEGLLY